MLIIIILLHLYSAFLDTQSALHSREGGGISSSSVALLTNCVTKCSCGSVVEHCVSSTNGCGFNSQGIRILTKKVYGLNAL